MRLKVLQRRSHCREYASPESCRGGLPSLTVNGEPVWTDPSDGFVAVTRQFAPGDRIVWSFEMAHGSRDLVGIHNIAGYHAFFAGPLMLGRMGRDEVHVGKGVRVIPEGERRYRLGDTGIVLAPINDLYEHDGLLDSAESMKLFTRQVLFSDR